MRLTAFYLLVKSLRSVISSAHLCRHYSMVEHRATGVINRGQMPAMLAAFVGLSIVFKGENLRHDHVLIAVNIFSIKRK